MKAILALENGEIYQGKSFGKEGEVIGEVVFNTGMTGYQEVLTDPSYCGQIVTMTYPLIGNYGVNSTDVESNKPQVKGFIVREACNTPSNFRSKKDINTYLKENNIIGIWDIDTRKLTKTLRIKGTMKGIITTNINFDFDEYKSKINSYKIQNPVSQVTTKKPKVYLGNKLNIGLLDLGVKNNIIKELNQRGHQVTVLPANISCEEFNKYNFDGLMLSNGPGDPKDAIEPILLLKRKIGEIPIFGICLGHQLTALAMGFNTHKLKFGHRGCNHPVKDLKNDRTYITSQNHGYAVSKDGLDLNKIEITHINNNDSTIEGLNYINLPLFTVQFHPEASPGPHDTSYLFDDFIDMIKKFKQIN